MKLDALIKMSKENPIEVIGQSRERSLSETVGSLVLWGGSVYAAMWAARWYTLKTLREKGVIT